MAGCLDHCRLPDWECFDKLREKRNAIASIVAGTLVRVLSLLYMLLCDFLLSLYDSKRVAGREPFFKVIFFILL